MTVKSRSLWEFLKKWTNTYMNEVTREQACSHKKQASCGMRRPTFVGLAQNITLCCILSLCKYYVQIFQCIERKELKEGLKLKNIGRLWLGCFRDRIAVWRLQACIWYASWWIEIHHPRWLNYSFWQFFLP